jgi:hypothetical protein
MQYEHSSSCSVYLQTQAGDFAQMVATHLFGVQLAFFLQDNVGEIQAMEQFLTPGLRLLVCWN